MGCSCFHLFNQTTLHAMEYHAQKDSFHYYTDHWSNYTVFRRGTHYIFWQCQHNLVSNTLMAFLHPFQLSVDSKLILSDFMDVLSLHLTVWKVSYPPSICLMRPEE